MSDLDLNPTLVKPTAAQKTGPKCPHCADVSRAMLGWLWLLSLAHRQEYLPAVLVIKF